MVLVADLDTTLVANSSTARFGVRESRQHPGQTTGPEPYRSDQLREVSRAPLSRNQDGAVVVLCR
ncbi:hypothetical protein OH799_29595 [Nocardia sp. NBC_00881]|uniref:hypothetical protein n=1 Tax=Nocardia sp. NBC_00881 TaxID=2975995 RepID=UPI00386B0410|nr:hypothetical protein OH799_29595 [Nocardia sp. NBC_00881]